MIDEILKLFVALIEVTFSLFGEIFQGLFDVFRQKPNIEYTAKFIRETKLLKRKNTGFVITGTRSLSRHDSYVNVMACGGTGSGKSSTLITPGLLSIRNCSLLIHDPGGNEYNKCSAAMVQAGFEVHVIHFARPDISAQFNPLDDVTTSSEAQKIATTLIRSVNPKGKGGDPFWENSAISLTSNHICLLQTQPKEYRNLHNLRYLITQMGSNSKAVDALYEQYADPVLRAEYAAFIASDEKVVSGVLATIRAALNLAADRSIAEVTAGNTLDIENIRRKPTAIFIMNGTQDAAYYAPLTSLMFEKVFGAVLKKLPEKDDLDMFFLIDEAATLTLPSLPQFVANSRKFRSGSMILLQDFRQLVHNYGAPNAETIRANCYTKMFFPGQPHETCVELEGICGKFQHTDKEGKVTIRPLMTVDEIRCMEKDQALIIAGNLPPIKATLTPYYKNRKLRTLATLPPAPFKKTTTLPLLTLPLPYVEED